MGKINSTLFVKYKNNDLIIMQIYVDDILFGATYARNLKIICIKKLRR
jgi:hypothetical protein